MKLTHLMLSLAIVASNGSVFAIANHPSSFQSNHNSLPQQGSQMTGHSAANCPYKNNTAFLSETKSDKHEHKQLASKASKQRGYKNAQ